MTFDGVTLFWLALIVVMVLIVIAAARRIWSNRGGGKDRPALSERELEVLDMVAAGSDNQDIAHQLMISVNTVKVHMRNIFAKMAVVSRAEAALQALKQRLVTLRLDAAVPERVTVEQTFEVGVAVKQLNAPLLAETDLPHLKSGKLQVTWPETVPFIQLRMAITAPDCVIHGEDSYHFRLYAGKDSPLFYFQLTPRKPGTISLVINVYQEGDRLGSTRIRTTAFEQLVGHVQVDISSHGLDSNGKNRAAIQNLITLQQRRLQKLKEIQAVKGIDTEPHYLLEIEDIEANLQSLRLRLRDQASKSG